MKMNGNRFNPNGNETIHYENIEEEDSSIITTSTTNLSTNLKLNGSTSNINNNNVIGKFFLRENDGFSTDEMLESEKSSLAGRVNDLERRCLTQQDEIVCLRSTLADVLRRLNLIEGNIERNGSTQTNTHNYGNGGRSAPSTPARSAPVPSFNRLTSPSPTNHSINTPNDWKLRKPLPRTPTHNIHHHQQQNSHHHETILRRHNVAATTLAQRKHHQSNGSLHSHSDTNSQSSSSVSPAPSPSPRPNSIHNQQNNNTNGSSGLGKRWNSTGDFSGGSMGGTQLQGRLSAKSLLNLASKPSMMASHMLKHGHSGSETEEIHIEDGETLNEEEFDEETLNEINDADDDVESGDELAYLKQNSKISKFENDENYKISYKGTHTASYNEDDGIVKMYLRGRPLNFHVPNEIKDAGYDITKVLPAPGKKLKLDWVYGYRGKDCRSNLYQLPTGEMVYFVAAVVVLYNADEQCQRHYLGHTDDIKSLAVHPNKILVATGQTAGHDRKEAMPHIRVWNSVSLATLAVIGAGEFTGSVNCISFSRADGGTLLTAIDDAPEKIISVWDWQKGEKGTRITETRCSVDTIVAVEFHPLDRNQIITVGKNHMSFWTLDHSGALYKRMGVFESREKPKYVTCIAFNQSGDVITGDSNGNIIVWGRGTNTIARFFKKVHEGSIFTLCTLKDGGLISGGGKDSRMVVFDEEMNRTGIEGLVEPHFGGIRVLSEGKGSQILIGTTRNCILIGSFDLGFTPVIMGHTEELWGLAAHPNMAQFVTGGCDQLLQLWDSLSHSVVWSKDIGEQVQSCDFSVDGDWIAVGTGSGRWMVFDTQTRELLAQHVDGQEPIQVIRFSPDGQFLAVGSRDNFIYVYQINDGPRFAKMGKCSGHSSFITHFDWSSDSQIIRSNSGDYELLFWNVATCRQITSASSVCDAEWATQSCTLSFNTLGIWPENADGTDVNSSERSNDKALLASGDDFGRVKLFSYPAIQPKTLSHSYGGHSSHVTTVTFLSDDTRLISTGGNDTSVMQWAVI